MTGLSNTDVKLSSDWQLTQAADGGVPLCSGLDCLYQSILLEALTAPGELFYDASFGWGLQDFIGSEDDELTRLEIMQRARTGLQRREVIQTGSIGVTVSRQGDGFCLSCSFAFAGEAESRQLDIVISAVNVEVVTVD